MKRLLMIFGALDVITLLRNYEQIINLRQIVNLPTDFTNFPVTIIVKFLVVISLGLSAYFLLRHKKEGLWLTYALFPFRLLFMILSFGFLLTVSRFFTEEAEFYKILIWILIGLELGRLLLTMQIHRKHFMSVRHSMNKG